MIYYYRFQLSDMLSNKLLTRPTIDTYKLFVKTQFRYFSIDKQSYLLSNGMNRVVLRRYIDNIDICLYIISSNIVHLCMIGISFLVKSSTTSHVPICVWTPFVRVIKLCRNPVLSFFYIVPPFSFYLVLLFSFCRTFHFRHELLLIPRL